MMAAADAYGQVALVAFALAHPERAREIPAHAIAGADALAILAETCAAAAPASPPDVVDLLLQLLDRRGPAVLHLARWLLSAPDDVIAAGEAELEEWRSEAIVPTTLERLGALERWRERVRARSTRGPCDVLWYAAALEAQARELWADGLHEAARFRLIQAAQAIQGAPDEVLQA